MLNKSKILKATFAIIAIAVPFGLISVGGYYAYKRYKDKKDKKEDKEENKEISE